MNTTNDTLIADFDDIEFADILETILETAEAAADFDPHFAYAYDEDFIACEKDLADIFAA